MEHSAVFMLKHLATGWWWTGRRWSKFGAEAKEFRREAAAIEASKKLGRRLSADLGGKTVSIAVVAVEVCHDD